MNLVAEWRRAATRRAAERVGLPEPERKRVCRSLETIPQSISSCHPPSKCAVDYWDMEQDLTQKSPTEFSTPRIMKEKTHDMILPDNETRTTAQTCLRCMAGEPGHFGHIMSL
uniref:Uncharacterized protein C10orf143 homolog n=1 Tax=Pogona vitticeps TaxID=103695 RepID=A0ABM5G1F7_9SAUR